MAFVLLMTVNIIYSGLEVLVISLVSDGNGRHVTAKFIHVKLSLCGTKLLTIVYPTYNFDETDFNAF
jgi:hypothetical protein